MKIPSISAYKDPFFNESLKPIGVNKNNSTDRLSKQEESRKENNTVSLKTESNLITRKERDYFIKMFPENQHQLEKHVVFNSQGRIQTHSYSKGLIIDGRV